MTFLLSPQHSKFYTTVRERQRQRIFCYLYLFVRSTSCFLWEKVHIFCHTALFEKLGLTDYKSPNEFQDWRWERIWIPLVLVSNLYTMSYIFCFENLHWKYGFFSKWKLKLIQFHTFQSTSKSFSKHVHFAVV